MRPCLKCGVSAPDAAIRCPACGTLLPTALGEAPLTTVVAPPGLDQTVPTLGQTPPDLGPTAPPLGQTLPNLGQTALTRGQTLPNLGQTPLTRGQTLPNLGQTAPVLTPLVAERQPAPREPALEKTMPAAELAPSPGVEGAASVSQTLFGHASPEVVPPPSMRGSGPAAFKGTMLGLGASDAPAPRGAALKSTMLGLAPQQPNAAAPAPGNSLRGTMIGMAPAVPAPPAEQEPPPEALSAAAAPLRVSDKKTMVGIARPGIAPLRPGVEKARVPSDPPPAGAFPAPPPPPAAPLTTAAGAGAARPLRIPTGAAIAIVTAAALFTAAAVALFLYRSRGAITASLDASTPGHEALALTCPGCTDESKVRLGGREASFRGTHATLALKDPLRVGDNRISVELERRPGRPEQVELRVPVDFRVRAETATLAQSPPHVTVRVEAVPHSAVVVDGKPLTFAPAPGGTETASAALDVSRSLTGMSSAVAMLEREIPYVVTPPDGNPASGQVKVRVGVTPLVVQAPGSSIVIEGPTFVLAGRTAKEGSVSVEGRPITVDASGAFAQMMSVSALGETNVIVRADAKDQAPRLVPVKVRRVQSLATEAAALRARATTAYGAIRATAEGQHGLAVALDGSVVDARSEAFTTVVLLDVKSGCSAPPCLARVNVGEKLALKPGSAVSVFGSVIGAVEGPRPGTRIPAIAADFLLKGRP